jgi:AcrR family transcriptional regulator
MTMTPWGDASELRGRRLRPGPGANPAAVTSNQRERMCAAMVASVAEHGYDGTRVADVVKLSGVSRSAFYKHFEDKLDCFLATLDATAALAYEQLARTSDESLPWDERLRAMADALLDLLLEQPAAARLCLVEIYAAGPTALARLDAAVLQAENALAEAFDASPERRGMPRDVVRAIVGGVLKTVHTRLRHNQEAELIHELPQLIDWGLSYDAPPTQLRRPRRRPDRGPVPLPDDTIARERLVTATTETIAKQGYSDAAIIEIASHASASLSTFYGLFENKEEAMLTALDRQREQALVAFRSAHGDVAEWPLALRAGIDALFAFLAAEPEATHLAFVDALSAGPDAREAGDLTIRAIQELLETGREAAPEQPPVVAEAVANALYALVSGQVRQERTERLRELAPTATFVQLAPYLGAAEACAAANA